MDVNESMAEAECIMSEAGWTVLPDRDTFCFEIGGFRMVGGIQPDKQGAHAKNLDWRKPGDPLYSADTPDEWHEAAQWLVERFKPAPNDISTEATLAPVTWEAIDTEGAGPPVYAPVATESLFGEVETEYGAGDETHGETSETEANFADDLEGALDSGGDPGGAADGVGGALSHEYPADDTLGGSEAGVPETLSELSDTGGPDLDGPIDADFTEQAAELLEGDDLIPERGIAWNPEDFAPDEIEPQSEAGPIAYAASDLDALVREKLGRVSQIARELKATLQDGWTLGEFASLQNLIVRIDRGESPDDATARSRFLAISERSQAMSRVDGHRDALEAALEEIGRARDYRAAVDFDPEQGWPGA